MPVRGPIITGEAITTRNYIVKLLSSVILVRQHRDFIGEDGLSLIGYRQGLFAELVRVVPADHIGGYRDLLGIVPVPDG